MKYEVDLDKLGKQRQPKANDPIVKALVTVRVFEALATMAEIVLTMSDEHRTPMYEAMVRTMAEHATKQGKSDLVKAMTQLRATLKEPTKETP